MASSNFYQEINALRLPVAEVLQHENFRDVPSDWSIVIADVQNSTAAVAAGKHNDVNLIAAGSIIAALNIAKMRDVEVPFFFSGDGGAVLVPNEMADEVLIALLLHNDNALKTVGLSMHIGYISVSEILSLGGAISISKIQLGDSLHKAIILGNGLRIAERLIKSAAKTPAPGHGATAGELNMDGLQCRWDKVKPPAGDNEIVCYLIEANDKLNQAEVYRRIMLKIDELYGAFENRSPLSMNRLRLLISLRKIEKEMMLRYGRWKIGYYLQTMIQNILGIFYFRYDLKIGTIKAKEYLAQLIANADTLTIDGRINTIISGKRGKRIELLSFLNGMEAKGEIYFGHHISRESIMTCYIENMNARHIHFVDGSDGGYTEAAKELKAKLAAIR